MIALVTKMATKRPKIEKLPFWAKIKAFSERFLRMRYQHKRIQKKTFNILCAIVILTLGENIFLVFACALC